MEGANHGSSQSTGLHKQELDTNPLTCIIPRRQRHVKEWKSCRQEVRCHVGLEPDPGAEIDYT